MTQAAYGWLRVVAGLLILQPGCLILFGWFGGMPGKPSPPPLMTQTGIGGLLEVAGGLLIMAGLLTRPAAFVLSGVMAVAYWQFHAPNGAWPIRNHGEPAVLLCFIFLYMAAQGAGEWSVDALLRKRKNLVVADTH
jgi:putative oxidoreductase